MMCKQPTRTLVSVVSIFSLGFLFYIALPEPAYAFTVLCDFLNSYTGHMLRGIATIGIIVLGLGAMIGKIEAKTAIMVAVGIAIIFGVHTIVNALGNGC